MVSSSSTIKHLIHLLLTVLVVMEVMSTTAEMTTSSEEVKSRQSRHYPLRYGYPWPPVERYHYYNDERVHHDGGLDESLVDSMSAEAVNWMRHLNSDQQENLMAWTLASAAVNQLTKQRNWAINNPLNYYAAYGQQRTPFYPSAGHQAQQVNGEGRTFYLIQQVVRRVATAIRQCQIGFFSPLINRCRQPTTTTPRTTVIWKTTTTPTTTSPSTTPLTTTPLTTTPTSTTTEQTTTSTTLLTSSTTQQTTSTMSSSTTPITTSVTTLPTTSETTSSTITFSTDSTTPTSTESTTTATAGPTVTTSASTETTTSHHPSATPTTGPAPKL